MGKRNRQRSKERLRADDAEYRSPDGDAVLTLRGAMSPGTRRQYADVAAGSPLSREDAWQRSVEFLFERLAVRWEVSGVATEGQKDLLARFRFASQEERAWIRSVLREHLAEHFPELSAP